MGKTEIPELVDLIRELMKQIEDLRTQLHTQRPCVAEANTQTEFQDISAPLTNDPRFQGHTQQTRSLDAKDLPEGITSTRRSFKKHGNLQQNELGGMQTQEEVRNQGDSSGNTP